MAQVFGDVIIPKSPSTAIMYGTGSLMVKALGCKPGGPGFETRWGEILNLPNPSCRTRPWGLFNLWQKWVPETLKKSFLGTKMRPVRGADNVTAIYEPIV
jgi:hypothetical protein